LPPTSEVIAKPPSPNRASNEAIELIWFDPTALTPIRQQAQWQTLLAQLLPESPAPDPDDFESEPPPPPSERMTAERDVVGILTRAKPSTANQLGHQLLKSVDEQGRFQAPLALVDGEVHCSFDEVQTLEATVAAVSPYVANNKKLKAVMDTADEFLQSSDSRQACNDVALALTRTIRDTCRATFKSEVLDRIDERSERILLEKRHYQTRMMFGSDWLRTELKTSKDEPALPTYLPESLRKDLPMFRRFRARIIGRVHVKQDQSEIVAIAIKVVAIARIVDLPRSLRVD